jgi:hypothetical protein
MNLVLTPLKLLAGLVGVFWMAIAGAWGLYAYERLPVGWPNREIRCCLVVRVTLHAPWAGAVSALEQPSPWRAAFLTEKASFDQVRAAIELQNARVLALATAGQAMAARANAAVAAARAANRSRDAAASAILALRGPENADELTLCRAADDVLKTGAAEE